MSHSRTNSQCVWCDVMQCKTHECSLLVTSHTNSHHFIFLILCPSVTCSHFLLPLTHGPVTSPLPPPPQLHASPLLPFAPPAQLCSLNSLKLTLLCELCAGWWSVSCSSTRLSPGTESTARWQIRYTHAHTQTDTHTHRQTDTHTHKHTRSCSTFPAGPVPAEDAVLQAAGVQTSGPYIISF